MRDLATEGHDVIALLKQEARPERNYSGDPAVGDVLRRLLDRVSEDPVLNTHASLLWEARRIIRDEVKRGRFG